MYWIVIKGEPSTAKIVKYVDKEYPNYINSSGRKEWQSKRKTVSKQLKFGQPLIDIWVHIGPHQLKKTE